MSSILTTYLVIVFHSGHINFMRNIPKASGIISLLMNFSKFFCRIHLQSTTPPPDLLGVLYTLEEEVVTMKLPHAALLLANVPQFDAYKGFFLTPFCLWKHLQPSAFCRSWGPHLPQSLLSKFLKVQHLQESILTPPQIIHTIMGFFYFLWLLKVLFFFHPVWISCYYLK